ncbi:tetratricopeptide repeat protein, partial [Patulibacter sp.]|uniref:tetratricopeptide repeat protein n=1 Tax=Patulibacter sp. TaxID=1912859 RepID=UPI00272477DF
MSGVDRAPELGRDPAGEALERSAALVAVGRAPEAEAVVRRALADDPDHADLRTELARVLVVDHRAAEAVEHADRAVAAAPEDPHAHAI